MTKAELEKKILEILEREVLICRSQNIIIGRHKAAEEIASLFEGYASQKPMDMPTEEEIEKVFPIKDCPVTQRDIDENNDSYWCQQGAKWYKNEIERRNK